MMNSAPAQIGFGKDGSTLIVTTKNHHQIHTVPIGKRGFPSPAPAVAA